MSNQENKPEDLKNPLEEIENLKQKPSFRPKLRHILVVLFLGVVISGAAARTWQISNKPKTIEPIAQDPNAPILLQPPPHNQCQLRLQQVLLLFLQL
jgi:hypothetical protein